MLSLYRQLSAAVSLVFACTSASMAAEVQRPHGTVRKAQHRCHSCGQCWLW